MRQDQNLRGHVCLITELAQLHHTIQAVLEGRDFVKGMPLKKFPTNVVIKLAITALHGQ